MNYRIDGQLFKKQYNDYDGDGISGENVPETYIDNNFNQGTQNITEPTELGEAIRELNRDDINKDTRMSSIDMKSRLHHLEISSILAYDTLVSMKFLPIESAPFTLIKKRLAVSQDGKGREEIVRIVAGKNENDIQKGSGGFGDRLKGFFGAGGGQN